MDNNAVWTARDVAKMIDHSLLNPVMTVKDITDGCKVAMAYDVATVCVKPSELALAAGELAGGGVLPTTVIGFPHGSNKTSVKVFEAREAIADGARELDMVLNIGRLLSLGHEKILLMYSPAVYETADVISTYVYRRGIEEAKFSFGAAVGLFNSAVNIVLLITANRISRAVNETSLW